MPTTFNPFGAQTFTLGSSISSTQNTILLSSFTEPVTGTPYTMVLLNTDIAYGTIGPRTSSTEFISFTGITQNADGTATLTGVVRGLAKKYPFTTDAAYKLPHSGQSIFIISDAPQLFNKYPTKDYDETITGQWTFTNTPIVPGTVSDASTTVKGVSKLSIAPAVANNPIAVGVNDTTILPTSDQKAALAGSGTPSVSNKYVTVSGLSAVYPVGSIYINAAVATNPATLLGFGTWTAFGSGRVLVGVDSGQTEFDTIGETGGEKTHALIEAELAAHTHTLNVAQSGTSNSQIVITGGSPLAVAGYIGSTGSGTAHNNLQPYIVVYMWQRTA
jgi:hypothetical protein